ncbi:MAG: hypothetical protein WBD27_01845, partial [Pyrinomonadaceae bacterium]
QQHRLVLHVPLKDYFSFLLHSSILKPLTPLCAKKKTAFSDSLSRVSRAFRLSLKVHGIDHLRTAP